MWKSPLKTNTILPELRLPPSQGGGERVPIEERDTGDRGKSQSIKKEEECTP